MKGIVCIDKPKGMTSSDVVVKVRNILSRTVGEKQKAGHFGTLDPDGQGVLIVGIGTANRLFDYVLKVFLSTLTLVIQNKAVSKRRKA